MKISKKQLRRIIKEEKRRLLREQFTRAAFSVNVETVDPEQVIDPEEVLLHLQDTLDEWALANREVLGALEIQVNLEHSS
jgi:hypothetical protein